MKKEMEQLKFMGYAREDGNVGIRNYVLILAVTHAAHTLAHMIHENVNGARVFIPEDEDGRSSRDRETIARVLIGLGRNPNVGSVLLLCSNRAVAYDELNVSRISLEIKKSGKEVRVLAMDECGGFYIALGEGIRMARELIWQASRSRRTEARMEDLFIGVKCGLSDATSGIAGNPVVGNFADMLVNSGGRFLFSETTEVIGAEHIIASRCRDEQVRNKFLQAVAKTEDEAQSIGEDIRTINPIPANIQAGITTLEEKSLGAIAKAGHSALEDVIAYGERPRGKGLFFMDSWMSSTTLFLGYAAAGATLGIFQMGGSCLPDRPVAPAIATGIVTPIFYVTGNPRTYRKGEMDFNAGTVIERTESIENAGLRLCESVLETASGMMTITETLNYQDRVEIYLKEPKL